MNAYLGIDGGGTKTKFTLADARGRILAEDIQPTCNCCQVGLDGLARVLRDGVAAVCAAAGVARGEIRSAFAGVPCYGDSATNIPSIRATVGEALAGIPHRVGNDSENALAGALAGAYGINIICGTGSIAFGRNAAGEVMRCGGWHHALGSDEGSGYWISLRILHAFTRQSDGRDPRTALYDAVREALDIEEDGDIIQRVVQEWNMDRTRVAALSRMITRLFEAGDPNAAAILRDAARELADMARTLYRKLGFAGRTPVSYSGGVFNIGAPILDPLAEELSAHGMRLVPPRLPPDQGALVLALQAAGVPVPEAFARADGTA